jgi:cytoskeletal protein RodZ
LKELGEYLKEQRESNSVGLEEASEDINISKEELENIEEGNIRAFKDVLSLKGKIKTYAKYLGLDPEEVLDEFNDFMFEHTSKISLSDILEASKKNDEEAKKQIRSPYTKIRRKKINVKGITVFITACLVVFIMIIVLLKLIEPKSPVINQELSGGGVTYEFTY